INMFTFFHYTLFVSINDLYSFPTRRSSDLFFMGRMQTELTNMLEIDYPIIQAPMAGGITSTTLVSESSNNGALGMVGAGYMTANELKQQIRDIKNETKKPFGVNVFVPAMTNSESAAEDYARHLLQPYYDTFQIDASTIEIANNTL